MFGQARPARAATLQWGLFGLGLGVVEAASTLSAQSLRYREPMTTRALSKATRRASFGVSR